MNAPSFKPAWWLTNRHMQTLWPVFCRTRIKNLKIERERMELPDGDFLDLDWVGQDRIAPLVVVLHGFEGSIDSHYVKGMLQMIDQQKWRGVLMHFRGCSGEVNRLAREYHAGDTEDLAWIVEQLHQRQPQSFIAAMGFSLGANVLLKWLGETGQANPLKTAVAISVPFELKRSVQCIQSGFSKLYQWNFLKNLRARLSKKLKRDLSDIRTVYDFDDKITAPLHGFSSADDYYKQSSSRQYLHGIRKPTLILQAKDDPFNVPDVIPKRDELSMDIQLEVSESGGHVGFVSGAFPWAARYWLEQRVCVFLRNHL